MNDTNDACDGYMTVQEFASLVGASRSQLLYYDRMGFFKPAVRAAAGKQASTRRYSPNQIYEYNMLCLMQRMGCTLKETDGYINADWAGCSDFLSLQQERLALEARRLQAMREAIDLMLRLRALVSGTTPQSPAFIELREPLRALYQAFDPPCLRGTKRFAEQYIHFFSCVRDNADILPSPIGLCYDMQPLADGRFPVTGIMALYRKGAGEGESNYALPSGRYLVVEIDAPIGGFRAAVGKSRDYMARASLRRQGDVISWNIGVSGTGAEAVHAECASIEVVGAE